MTNIVVGAGAPLSALPESIRGNARSGKGKPVAVSTFETVLGCMLAGATEEALVFLEFATENSSDVRLGRHRSAANLALFRGRNLVHERIEMEVAEFFEGGRVKFDTPFELAGTPFQLTVWRSLCEIPYGETLSYGTLADRLSCPGAVRAVANANARNRLAIIVPCHRVVGRNGKLTGYAGGLEKKRYLLDLEARTAGRAVQADLF